MRRDANTPAGDGTVAGQEPSDEAASRPHLPELRTLLLCRPNTRLGNTVLMTPLVQEIERRLPQVRMDLLTAFPGAPEVFSGFPGIRTIHRLPFRGARHGLRYLATVLKAASVRYDMVMDPEPQSWTSGFLTRLMRSSCKVGFESPRKHRPAYLSTPLEGAPAHMGTFPVYLFRRAVLGMDASQAAQDLPLLDLRLSPAEREEGRRQLLQCVRTEGPVIALAGSATGAKRFAVAWWRELAQRLLAQSPGVQLLEIRPPSGEASFPEYPGYASRSLRQVASLIAATDCFVSADSGLMHLGAASGCPTVGLFKITNPVVYAPYGPQNIALSLKNEEREPVCAQVAQVLKQAQQRRQAS